MDSILVVFYSYTGVSRRVAQQLASQRGWPLGEIREREPRWGARGNLRCVLDSLLARRPAIRYEGPDPAHFRTVVIVSPIWAYRLAGPMRSFLVEHVAHLTRVAQVTTMGEAGASNAIAEVARLLGRAPILTAEFTAREIADDTGTTRLLQFADALVPGSTASQRAPHPALTPADMLPASAQRG
jgi:hypothetical protein